MARIDPLEPCLLCDRPPPAPGEEIRDALEHILHYMEARVMDVRAGAASATPEALRGAEASIERLRELVAVYELEAFVEARCPVPSHPAPGV